MKRYAKGQQYLGDKCSRGALYRCLLCGHRFEGDAGGVTWFGKIPRANSCWECGHTLVKWENFEEFRREHPLPPLVRVEKE